MHSSLFIDEVHSHGGVGKHLYYTLLQGCMKGLEGPLYCSEFQYVDMQSGVQGVPQAMYLQVLVMHVPVQIDIVKEGEAPFIPPMKLLQHSKMNGIWHYICVATSHPVLMFRREKGMNVGGQGCRKWP